MSGSLTITSPSFYPQWDRTTAGVLAENFILPNCERGEWVDPTDDALVATGAPPELCSLVRFYIMRDWT
jgi:hypothetical protein